MNALDKVAESDLHWMRRALELARRGKNRRNHAARRAIFTRRLFMAFARS